MYAPVVNSADTLEEFELENYNARLLGNIVSVGGIQYKFILAIYLKHHEQPFLFITSETSEITKMFGGEAYFLCAFEGGQHLNFGSSKEWGDLFQFKMRALAMADSYISKGNFNG